MAGNLAQLASQIEEAAIMIVLMERLGVEKIEISRHELQRLRDHKVIREDDVQTGAVRFTIFRRG